jgi:hypothetical protein
VAFIQIIEYSTSKPDEIEKLDDEWIAATKGKRSASKVTRVADRDNPGRYFQIVEFPSYEAAMKNSQMPETGEMAAKITALVDGEPTFYNLDVVKTLDL